jgi:outer membrane protein OmpA-like peptidoglycan-associated protein
MKKWISLTPALGILFTTIAQEKNLYRKNHTLGVHFTLHDFKTAALLKNSSLSDVLNKGDWNNISEMNPGFAFSYMKGLTNNLDVMARLGYSNLEYPRPGTNPGINSNAKALIETDVNLNVKLLSDKYWVSPFISIGAGASQWNGYYAAYFPTGLGLQLNLYDQVFGLVQAQYRLPISANAANNLFYSFGLGANIGKKKEVIVPAPPPLPVVVPVDTDGDGIVDTEDACPTVAGLAKFKGCPDTDKDGIQDSEDKCPTVAGIAQFQGCPDTDGDGIQDSEDKCPTVAGLARYQGCPIPDTDGDGVNDEEDRCPDVPGVVENKGCPKVDFQASDVTFQSGKAVLLPAGKKELDVLVDLLKKNPNVRISLEGHTDNTGTDKINDPLSANRAAAAEAYLVSKGIEADRMDTAGFGSKVPVADNKTAAGKKLNRRVEVKVL